MPPAISLFNIRICISLAYMYLIKTCKLEVPPAFVLIGHCPKTCIRNAAKALKQVNRLANTWVCVRLNMSIK